MQIIAHRGASGYAPENTLAAIRLALEQGARAVEIDVHQTRDHELVVLHDENLKRVGRKKGKIKDLRLSELAGVDVGSWFNRRFQAERVPRLEQVLDLLEGRAELHLEIKRGSGFYPGIEERVVDLLHKRRALKTTLVSSFDHAALYSVRSLDPAVRLGYLLGLTRLPTAFRETSELKAESLNISMRQASARRVRAAHARGLKVLVYTVNEAAHAVRLEKMGVDAVFSNFPDLGLKP